MPLLKRRAFRRASCNELLRDDDEVFHCEITDEIFKDYEEYCERIILVNSMVWSCEMTGKPNLTYAEALESERNARRSLKNFPLQLKVPILYLANKTKRSSLADMLEDVFNFVRERYFVGETVEACLEGDQWCEVHVMSVIAPKQSPDANSSVKPASMYMYEVERWNDEDASAAGELSTVPAERVRRRKGVFTRDKNKLFLKQFVEQTMPGGLFVVKKQALDKYNILKVRFENLFTGPPPEFPSSKKLLKPPAVAQKPSPKPGSATKPNSATKQKKKPSPDKKGQQSIAKYMTKTDKNEATAPKPKPVEPKPVNSGVSLKEEMARASAALQQRRLDEKEREKEKKKERKAKLAAYIKEWHRQKDDLDLEDHKMLPIATPVEIEGIPQKMIGDFLSVLEFVHLYADILKTKDVFHRGIHIELLRQALLEKENSGLFSDMIQMFLTTIFSLMEEESEEVNESGIQESDDKSNLNVEAGSKMLKAMELATKASRWPQTYLATPLSRLPLDAFTVSEVLRLHLLSSGATAGERCARWRYQQRGGYSSLDDAGLHLRLSHPNVIRSLATVHVAALPLDEKFIILQCLMNQILSYATVRDVIEEKLDNLRSIKNDLRMLQASEKRREAELVAARIKLNKDMKLQSVPTPADESSEPRATPETLDKLEKEHEAKKQENEKRIKQLQAQCFDYLSYLGMDRAYRSYWLNQAVPGLFVEVDSTHRGPCKDKPVLPISPPADTLQYVSKLFESEKGASDKENDSANTSRNSSPKKQMNNINGISQKLSNLETSVQQMQELLMCTGNQASCPVHGQAESKPRWWVYHQGAQLDALLEALNKRGLREVELKHNLELDKKSIVEYVEKCPITLLNKQMHPPVSLSATTMTRAKKAPQSSISVPHDATLSDALELSLRDYILELEEKVFHGCLGSLKVKDRESWRGTILMRNYDKQVGHLSWGPDKMFRDDVHLPNGKLLRTTVKDSESGEEVKPVVNTYRDPGSLLECRQDWPAKVDTIREYKPVPPHISDLKLINGGVSPVKEPRVEIKRETIPMEVEHDSTVHSLACALLQIEQSIHHKYIKRPLGYDEKERKDYDAKGKPLDFKALARWEVSLMECSSFAQVALHLLTLDSSVMWSASILNASCRLCRRKTDADNMLLCDSCNKGHHMYCLKPKLYKVPEGDWFCDQCKPKEKPQTPRKRRKLFNDNIQEEEEEEEEEEESDEEEADSDTPTDVCQECGSGGRLSATCVACRCSWHAECAQPRPPRNTAKPWKCALCLITKRRENTGRRRCHADAINNIHQITRTLNNASRLSSTDSDSSDDNLPIRGRARVSKESSPINRHASNGHSNKRGRRSVEDAPPPKKARASAGPVLNGHSTRPKKSIEEAPTNRRRSKLSAPNTPVVNGNHDRVKSKRTSRGAILHRAAAEQFLNDVKRHRDAWPFCEPVNTEEVPDYSEIVSEPMDFQTISEKLDEGDYVSDEQVMHDAALVFKNCFLYNRDTHPVARAGVRLEKYCQKRAAELSLPALPDLPLEAEEETSKKSRRTK